MIRVGRLASVTGRMVSMIGKEQWAQAAKADVAEIDRLTTYLSQRKASRAFRKKPSTDQTVPVLNESAEPTARQAPPFHYLRNDLNILLGPSGAKLLNNTWTKFHLSPAERSPERLRPALVKLFSVAARIAAPRGVGQALKRLVSDFERVYFPIVDSRQEEPRHQKARRFALLTALQDGKGDRLLSSLLGAPDSGSDLRPLPSRLNEDDDYLARRRFLFESACRAKSWSEAYRQARLLSPRSELTSSFSIRTKYSHLCHTLSRDHSCPAKKKQLLVDLAALTTDNPSLQLDYALRAVTAPIQDCRPGDIERLVCRILPSADPRWRLALARLYRHSPESGRWMSDFRTLWQAEPSLQPRLKVLLNLLRLPKVRVEASLNRRGTDGRLCRDLTPATVKARLAKVREQVKLWQEIVPPYTGTKSGSGAAVYIDQSWWSFIAEVCAKLDIEPPVHVRTDLHPQPVVSGLRNGQRYLSLSPEFFRLEDTERKFLLARGLFRGAAGLDALESRLRSLHSPQELRERAAAYAEWMGHSHQLLDDSIHDEVEFSTLLVGLEELFWNTLDETYRRLAAIAHKGCWCPLFESEADHFAAGFVDIVSASHALARTVDLVYRATKPSPALDGLSALFNSESPDRVLSLRLQRLWVSYLD